MNIIFWGALITIIGALITAIGTFNQNKSSSKKMQHLTDNSEDQTKKIERLQTLNETLSLTVDNLNQKAIEQLNTIVQLSKQNSDLALQLSNSTKTLYDNITGDQSFCEFKIQPFSNDSARLILIHHGNSAVYNVGVNIIDVAIMNQFKDFKVAMSKGSVSLKIGDVNKNTGSLLSVLTSDFSSGNKKFNIQISTRNHSYVQNILLLKTNGVWKSATKIRYFDADNQNKIYESNDVDFPLEKLRWE